ncbi:MAG TPA: lytic murein transglycosylase B [Rhodocyclaceae bacterium]|nr:lytic murein transglycosylase B [Rhodocyclaceae bacterium]
MTRYTTTYAKSIALFSLAFCLSQSAFSLDAQGRAYSQRDDVQTFIADIAKKDDFPQAWLTLLFDQAEFKPAVIKAILPPVNPAIKSWQTYRGRFVEPKRIAAGLAFWNQYADVVKRASDQYGVPEEIIVAIIGVETIYGRNMGNFETFSALTTLAFDYPPRADLFRQQLEELLLLARDEGRNPRDYTGSFAGALGLPQFLPGSIRKYAVDFDGNGDVDVATPIDAIGSVANFLAQHGWVKGGPIIASAQISDADAAPLIALGLKPQLMPKNMTGVISPNAPQEDAALIDLVTPGQPTEYRLGYQNFYVISRYNRSSFYATAVCDLARALKEKHEVRL